MSEVKIFKIKGRMLLSHDRLPEWRDFTLYVRALKKEHALERVYSELGSRHKLKRYHIKIEEVREVSLDEVEDLNIIRLSTMKGWVKA